MKEWEKREREGNDRVFDISLTSDFRLSLLEISFSGELTRASRVANEAVSNRRSAEQKYRPSSPAAKSCKENGVLSVLPQSAHLSFTSIIVSW